MNNLSSNEINFVNHVLLPTLLEQEIYGIPQAHSCKPTIPCKIVSSDETIYLQNLRGWRITEIGIYIREAGDSLVHYFNPARVTSISNTNVGSSSYIALIRAVVTLGIGSIFLTGYLMTQSLKQTIDSKKAYAKVTEVYLKLGSPAGYPKQLTLFRKNILMQSYYHNLADTIENIVIITALALDTIGWSPRIGSIVIIGAALIAKFVTKKRWPNFTNDTQLQSHIKSIVDTAQTMWKYPDSDFSKAGNTLPDSYDYKIRHSFHLDFDSLKRADVLATTPFTLTHICSYIIKPLM